MPNLYSASESSKGFTVTGIREVCDAFDKLPQAVVMLGYLKALEAAADVIEPALKQNTPVGQVAVWNPETFSVVMAPSGSLKRSVQRRIELDKHGAGGLLYVHFGKLNFIANFLEYGHNIVTHWASKVPYKDSRGRLRYKKSGGHVIVGFVKPNPFIRETADQVFEPVIDAVTESITKTVNENGGILANVNAA